MSNQVDPFDLCTCSGWSNDCEGFHTTDGTLWYVCTGDKTGMLCEPSSVATGIEGMRKDLNKSRELDPLGALMIGHIHGNKIGSKEQDS